MNNVLKLLFGKSSMRSKKCEASDSALLTIVRVYKLYLLTYRCTVIALVSLYPSCYPLTNCCFGRKCCVVEIRFRADWQSVVMPVSLLWLLNFTSNLMPLFVLVLHVLRTAFGFIFLN